MKLDQTRLLVTRGLGAAIGKPDALDRTRLLSTKGLNVMPGKPGGSDF